MDGKVVDTKPKTSHQPTSQT